MVREMEQVKVAGDTPTKEVLITDCGELPAAALDQAAGPSVRP